MKFPICPAQSATSCSGAQVIEGSVGFKNGSVTWTGRQTMIRTPTTAGNRRVWTLSAWLKYGYPDTAPVFGCLTSGDTFDETNVRWTSQKYGMSSGGSWNTTFDPKIRDSSQWHHLVWAQDTTQTAENDRVKLWINGVGITTMANATWPTQNGESSINSTSQHEIGGRGDTDSVWLDGQMSEVYFIDGQQLNASYFGFSDPLTDTWRPKKYINTVASPGDKSGVVGFGTNGFYLPMNGRYGPGVDQSGQGNDYFGGPFMPASVVPQETTAALPIWNTCNGGRIASAGIRTDPLSQYCVLAVPLWGRGATSGGVGIASDYSHLINSTSTEKVPTLHDYGSGQGPIGVRTAYNFYNESVFFDGDEAYTNGSSISYADSTDFEFGSGDYTLEGWIQPTGDLGNSDENCIISKYQATGSKREWMLFLDSGSGNDRLRWSWSNDSGGSATHIYSATGKIKSAGGAGNIGWYHWAVCKDSTNVRMYVNGVQQDDVNSSPGTITGTDRDLSIGAYYSGTTVGKNGMYRGFQSDVRIYKGVAKYANGVNFTPASSQPALMKDSPSGVVHKAAFETPPSGSGYFDGGSDWVKSSSTSSDYAMGSGDFTIECFCYFNSTADYAYLWDFRHDDDADNLIYCYQNINQDKLHVGVGAVGSVDAGICPINKWNHVALVRQSGTVKTYINGNNTHTFSEATDISASNSLYIGARYSEAYTAAGWISNFRAVKGTAVYTSNFIPPTEPLKSITNTKVLMLQSVDDVTETVTAPTAMTAVATAHAQTFNPFDNINTCQGPPANYATLNYYCKGIDCQTYHGNLHAKYAGVTGRTATPATVGVKNGKYYWEHQIIGGFYTKGIGPDSLDFDTFLTLGITNTYNNAETTGSDSIGKWLGHTSAGWGLGGWDSEPYNNNSTIDADYMDGAVFAVGDIIGVAFDADNGKVYWHKNGVYGGPNGNPQKGLNPGATVTTGVMYYPAIGQGDGPGDGSDGCEVECNFGQRPFAYTPPLGYSPVCVTNADIGTTMDPVPARPDQVVGITSYTGTGGGNNHVHTLKFSPDFIWIKCRNAGSTDHMVFDTIRGFDGSGDAEYLSPNTNSAQGSDSGHHLQSFDVNGFTLQGTSSRTNYDDSTYAAWCFKAGGSKGTYNIDDVEYASASAAGLTDGNYNPTACSINTKGGFGIVTWNGDLTGSGTKSIAHGMPGFADASWMIISKRYEGGTSDWWVQHSAIANGADVLKLNSSAGKTSISSDGTLTSPTNTLFYGNWNSGLAGSTNNIAYYWKEIPGQQKFGYYMGSNDSEQGAFVYTGFRPAMIMTKRMGDTSDWVIWDNRRSNYGTPDGFGAYNPNPYQLFAEDDTGGNTYDAQSSNYPVQIFSNGFKMVTTDGNVNAAQDYIYCCWGSQAFNNLYGAESNGGVISKPS